MTDRNLSEHLLSFANTKLDYPFGPQLAVYQVATDDDHWEMFAILENQTKPNRLSLRCDPQLAQALRSRYESVLAGHNLNKIHWNTIILSGQLSHQKIDDLIAHSYLIAQDGPPPIIPFNTGLIRVDQRKNPINQP